MRGRTVRLGVIASAGGVAGIPWTEIALSSLTLADPGAQGASWDSATGVLSWTGTLLTNSNKPRLTASIGSLATLVAATRGGLLQLRLKLDPTEFGTANIAAMLGLMAAAGDFTNAIWGAVGSSPTARLGVGTGNGNPPASDVLTSVTWDTLQVTIPLSTEPATGGSVVVQAIDSSTGAVRRTWSGNWATELTAANPVVAVLAYSTVADSFTILKLEYRVI